MDSCSKCSRVLYYEPTMGDMCMDCWEKFGRLEIVIHSEEPPTEWIPIEGVKE